MTKHQPQSRTLILPHAHTRTLPASWEPSSGSVRTSLRQRLRAILQASARAWRCAREPTAARGAAECTHRRHGGGVVSVVKGRHRRLPARPLSPAVAPRVLQRGKRPPLDVPDEGGNQWSSGRPLESHVAEWAWHHSTYSCRITEAAARASAISSVHARRMSAVASRPVTSNTWPAAAPPAAVPAPRPAAPAPRPAAAAALQLTPLDTTSSAPCWAPSR